MDKLLIKNIVSLFGVQGVSYIAPLITLPYLVRVLGPESYGVLGFSLAFVQYFVMLTDYGFNLSATHDIAVCKSNKKEVSKTFWAVIYCKVIFAVGSLVAVVAMCYFIPFLRSQSIVIYAAFGMVISNVIFPVWLFQGMEKMGWCSILNIISRLLAIPLTFIYVNSHQDAWVAALIVSGTALFGGVVSSFIIYKEKWVSFQSINRSDIYLQVRSSWHLFISSAAVNLYTSSVTVILGLS